MTTTRKNGIASVYQRTTGTRAWVAEVWFDGTRKRISAPTRPEAYSAAEEWLDGRDRRSGGERTVAELATMWTQSALKPSGRRKATINTHEWALGYVVDRFGHLPAHELRALDIQDWLAEVRQTRNGKPMSKSSLKKLRNALATIYRFGMLHRIVSENPALVTDLPDAATATRVSLSVADAVKLYRHLEGDEMFGPLFRLQMLTGLRPGEAAGLQWSAIEGDVLVVRTAARTVDGRVEMTDQLKTSSSRRTLHLSPEALALLAAQRRHVAARQLAASRWYDHDLVFPNSLGRPHNAASLRRSLTTLCRKAEVPRITPHELRHTAASLMADAGVPLESVSNVLGHAELRITQNYVHQLKPAVGADASAATARVLGR